MSSNKSTHCPWTYRAMAVEGDTVRPCSNAQDCSSISNSTLSYEFENGSINEYRVRLDQGEKLKSCFQCWDHENAGIQSLRQKGIERWGYVDTPSLEYLEFGIDNTCNLRCHQCSSSLSTSWIKDEQKIFGRSINKDVIINNTVYENIDLSKIKTVKFVGGEPLMSSAVTHLSKKLLDLKDLEVLISTNGTMLPNETLENLFLNCKILRLSISVDGIDRLNNFIRYNSQWKDLEKSFEYYNNLIDIRKDKNTFINFHTTINVYNVNVYNDIEDYFKKKYPRFIPSKANLSKPDFLSIKHLPEEYKKEIESTITDKDILAFLNKTETNLFDYFLAYHKKVINIRNIDFQNINPTLNKYIESYKSTDVSFEKVFLMKSGFDHGL